MRDPILGPLAVVIWLAAVLLFGIWIVTTLMLLAGRPL